MDTAFSYQGVFVLVGASLSRNYRDTSNEGKFWFCLNESQASLYTSFNSGHIVFLTGCFCLGWGKFVTQLWGHIKIKENSGYCLNQSQASLYTSFNSGHMVFLTGCFCLGWGKFVTQLWGHIKIKENSGYCLNQSQASLYTSFNGGHMVFLPGCFCLGWGRFVTQVCGHIKILAGCSEPSMNFCLVSWMWTPPLLFYKNNN